MYQLGQNLPPLYFHYARSSITIRIPGQVLHSNGEYVSDYEMFWYSDAIQKTRQFWMVFEWLHGRPVYVNLLP